MSWSIVGWDHVLIRIDFRLNWMWNYVHLSEHFTPWSGESLWSFSSTDSRYLRRIQRSPIAPFSTADLVSEGVARPLSISFTCQRRFCGPSRQPSLSRPLAQHIKYLMAFHFLDTQQRRRNQSSFMPAAPGRMMNTPPSLWVRQMRISTGNISLWITLNPSTLAPPFLPSTHIHRPITRSTALSLLLPPPTSTYRHQLHLHDVQQSVKLILKTRVTLLSPMPISPLSYATLSGIFAPPPTYSTLHPPPFYPSTKDTSSSFTGD